MTQLQPAMIAISLVLLFICRAQAQNRAAALSFTGNVERDFPLREGALPPTVAVQVAVDGVDTGVPPGWPYMFTGWDFKDLRFVYDWQNDALHVGINCFGVCGDADGDGNPSSASSDLRSRGGQDLPGFRQSESCAMALDIGSADQVSPDNTFELIVGYPAGEADDSEAFPAPCTSDFDTKCFGLYRYQQSLGVEQIGQRCVFKSDDSLLTTVRSENLAVDQNPVQSLAKPDLEWSIFEFNKVRQLAGGLPIDSNGVQSFAIGVAAFCGSFQDDGVGEDTFPNLAPSAQIVFPCQNVDPCNVCQGNGRSCACKIENDEPIYRDQCGECGGDGSGCTVDCAGAVNGTKVFNACGDCAAPSSVDCTALPTDAPTPVPTPQPTPTPATFPPTPPVPPTPVPTKKLASVAFTGDVERDFRGEAVIVDDGRDVGVPPNWPYPYSGWDIKDIRFVYDWKYDALHIGINCFGICGDADGDGDPSSASPRLLSAGGQDFRDFTMSESCAVALDIGTSTQVAPDGFFDMLIGYPASEADGSESFPKPCTPRFDQTCFGVYLYQESMGVEQLGQRFVWKNNDALLKTIRDQELAVDQNPVQSRAKPDLEWSLFEFNKVREAANRPKIGENGEGFSIAIAAFCGSYQDDGVGEDAVPNDSLSVIVDFPSFSEVGTQSESESAAEPLPESHSANNPSVQVAEDADPDVEQDFVGSSVRLSVATFATFAAIIVNSFIHAY